MVFFSPMLLYEEVQKSDLEKNFNTFRMSPASLNFLLGKICASIEKKNTLMRKAIPAKVRLMVTLRFLTSGASFR